MNTENNDLQQLANSEKPVSMPNPMTQKTTPNKSTSKPSLVAIMALVIAIVALLLAAGTLTFAIIQSTHDNCSSSGSSVPSSTYHDHGLIEKPLIYLYPETETVVNVKLGNPNKLTASYPTYTDGGWQVIAQPDGDLLDTKTDRHLYGLYWEGKDGTPQVTNEGFVVEGSQTASFLEEKLATLGLNEREANEFIIYWLPKLQNNQYNYIRFATTQEIEQNMPLFVTPTPDTIIRVFMVTQPLQSSISIQEQQLQTPVRRGFTVLEWGGTIAQSQLTE